MFIQVMAAFPAADMDILWGILAIKWEKSQQFELIWVDRYR